MEKRRCKVKLITRKKEKEGLHPMYHNMELLLKKYRDTIWGLEIAVNQARLRFKSEFDMEIEDFLNVSYCAGMELGGTAIESQVKSIERTKKMLVILENSVNIMRNRHKYGEAYYWILYYTYLCPQQLQSTNEIIEKLMVHIPNISYRTYYRKRGEAIDVLSSVLWGFTAKDCLEILKNFIPE